MNDLSYDIEQMNRGVNVQEELEQANEEAETKLIISIVPIALIMAFIIWIVKLCLNPIIKSTVNALDKEDVNE
jgi:hypothetical protein